MTYFEEHGIKLYVTSDDAACHLVTSEVISCIVHQNYLNLNSKE